MQGGPKAAELAAFGLTVEDVADEYGIEVWPDTRQAVLMFIALRTQWRMGPVGPVGLDYACLPAAFHLRGIPRNERADLFDDLRVMEDEALRLFAEESK